MIRDAYETIAYRKFTHLKELKCNQKILIYFFQHYLTQELMPTSITLVNIYHMSKFLGVTNGMNQYHIPSLSS